MTPLKHDAFSRLLLVIASRRRSNPPIGTARVWIALHRQAGARNDEQERPDLNSSLSNIADRDLRIPLQPTMRSAGERCPELPSGAKPQHIAKRIFSVMGRLG
jgi:hypothetical protein